MKNIKIAVFCWIISFGYSNAQTHSESIADVVVAGQKMTITDLLLSEMVLLNTQRDLIRKIKNEERVYQNKIGPLSNMSNTVAYSATIMIIEGLNKKISDIEYNIGLIKLFSFGLRHGLSRHETELKRQKEYYNKLEEDKKMLISSIPISGGAGENYTATIKLLVRAIKIRAKIFQIDKDVKSLMKASWLLSR